MASTAPVLDDETADYIESDEVRAVAVGLINRITTIQDVVSDLRIAFKLRLGEPSGEGEAILAACQKATPIVRDHAEVDVFIWVWQAVWTELDARQREALVLHELLHVDRTEKGAVKIRKHQIEEFHMVVAEYGLWSADIAMFARALQLHEGRPAKVRSIKGGRS